MHTRQYKFSWLRRTIALALGALTLVLGIGIVDAPEATATLPTQTLNMLGGNTSSALPVGSADPYTDVTIDNGVTWRPAILSGNGHPWNDPAGVNSWINCQSVTAYPWDACAPSPTMQNPVRALFRYRFWIASDYGSSGSLSGEFNVDNFAKFYLNGIANANCFLGCLENAGYGIGGGQNTTTVAAHNNGQPASINSHLVAGWNTFYVELLDVGGQSGIIYNLTLSIESAYPITVAAPGTLVTFDAQGGTSSSQTESVGFNQALSTITMPTATLPGYVFDGWYTQPVGGTLVNPAYAAATIPTADMTLYAHWSVAPTPSPTPDLADTGGSENAASRLAFSAAAIALGVLGMAVRGRLRRRKQEISQTESHSFRRTA